MLIPQKTHPRNIYTSSGNDLIGILNYFMDLADCKISDFNSISTKLLYRYVLPIFRTYLQDYTYINIKKIVPNI